MALKLIPDPTFKAPVEIHVPGKSPQKVVFTFKYRDADEMKEFLETLKQTRGDLEVVRDIATGWDVDAEFTDENIEVFLKKYIRSGAAILNGYVKESLGAAAGN